MMGTEPDYSFVRRSLLVDSSGTATGFQKVVEDTTGPATASIGGDPSAEALSCLSLSTDKQQLVCLPAQTG